MYRLVLVAFILGSPTWAFGQVSIVNALPDAISKNGWSNSFATSGVYRQDNNFEEKLKLSAAGALMYKERKWLVYGLTKGAYETENGSTQEFSVMEHLRARITAAGLMQKRPTEYGWWDRFMLEMFTQHEFDQFRKLDVRFLLGAGPAIHVLHGEEYDLMFGSAYMFEYLDFTFPSQEFNHRWSNYLQLKLKANDRLKFDGVTFIQVKFNDFTDVLCMWSIAMTTRATKWLSVQFSVGFNIDSRPPAGAKGFGVQTGSALVMEF